MQVRSYVVGLASLCVLLDADSTRFPLPGSKEEFLRVLPSVVKLVGFPAEYSRIVAVMARLAHGDTAVLPEIWSHDGATKILAEVAQFAMSGTLKEFTDVLVSVAQLMVDEGILPAGLDGQDLIEVFACESGAHAAIELANMVDTDVDNIVTTVLNVVLRATGTAHPKAKRLVAECTASTAVLRRVWLA